MNDYLNQFDLNYTCDVIRITVTNDSYCNLTTVETTVVSDKKCGWWQSVGNEVVIGDRVHNPINAQLAIEPSTEYRPTDRVIVNGTTYTMGNPHNIANEDAIMVFNLESIE